MAQTARRGSLLNASAAAALCALVPAGFARAAEVVETRNGRKVLLMDDKTWDYVPAPAAGAVRFADQAVHIWDSELRVGVVDRKNAVLLFLHYQNNTDKRVTAVRSRVTVTDPFGEKVFRRVLKQTVALASGAQKKNDRYFYFDEAPESRKDYDVLWPLAQNNAARLSIEVLEVALEDGSVLLAR